MTIQGNLLNAFDDGHDAIFHCCNCQINFGSGLALAVKNKWPEAYQADVDFHLGGRERMGEVSEVDIGGGTVYNLYGQYRYGVGRNLDYEAFYIGLRKIASRMKARSKTMVACAVNTGCDRAGGDWRIVTAMIEAVFGEAGINIAYYKL